MKLQPQCRTIEVAHDTDLVHTNMSIRYKIRKVYTDNEVTFVQNPNGRSYRTIEEAKYILKHFSEDLESKDTIVTEANEGNMYIVNRKGKNHYTAIYYIEAYETTTEWIVKETIYNHKDGKLATIIGKKGKESECYLYMQAKANRMHDNGYFLDGSNDTKEVLVLTDDFGEILETYTIKIEKL